LKPFDSTENGFEMYPSPTLSFTLCLVPSARKELLTAKFKKEPIATLPNAGFGSGNGAVAT